MKTTIISLSLVLLIFSSCKKGDTGPAGAAGPKGNANVQYSTWAPLNMRLSATDSLYEQVITADSLKQSILDSGLVLTYLKITTTNQPTQIVAADVYMEVLYGVGKISLFAQNDFSGAGFRYIIIPGGSKVGKITAGGLQGYSKEQLKAKPYDEIIKLLGSN